MGLQKDSETGINIRLNVTQAVCCRYLNDVEIVNNEHFKVGEKPDEYIFRVDIDDVNEDHCGKIKVVGKNENGQDVKEVSGVVFLPRRGSSVGRASERSQSGASLLKPRETIFSLIIITPR